MSQLAMGDMLDWYSPILMYQAFQYISIRMDNICIQHLQTYRYLLQQLAPKHHLPWVKNFVCLGYEIDIFMHILELFLIHGLIILQISHSADFTWVTLDSQKGWAE